MNEKYILTISCLDHPGIVAATATLLAKHGCNILDAQQFSDLATGRFFMRVEFAFVAADQFEVLRQALVPVAREHGLEYQARAASTRQRVLLLVSRLDHCLADLLYRWRIGELPMDVVGIVANHPLETYRHVDIADVPFHYLPVVNDDKAAQESRVWELIQSTRADLVVLARYMQILSDQLASRLAGRCINIHHSFLPGFKGARPYHQAHERGVKLIGATAHFVTGELDEGPIIEQDVERVALNDDPEALIRKGRDIERRVLSRAVGWFLADRVLLNGHKTVVFP